MKKIWPVLFLLCCMAQGRGQSPTGEYLYRYAYNGDSLFIYVLDPVEVSTPRVFKSKQEERAYRRYTAEYNRMLYNIRRAYPFAVATREQLKVLNARYSKITSGKERKEYIKKVEAELREQFEDDLKRLTFRQGLILLKLIDRETNNNAYELIKEFRGGVTATFFQTFARLFKINLKTEYDPRGEDKMIEEIVVKLEQGLL